MPGVKTRVLKPFYWRDRTLFEWQVGDEFEQPDGSVDGVAMSDGELVRMVASGYLDDSFDPDLISDERAREILDNSWYYRNPPCKGCKPH